VFDYSSCGLPVTLVNVEVGRCEACGGSEVAIPAIEQLHRLIAHDVATKRERLTPQEIRYLRKWLGHSGADFAAVVGVTPETVSRWENGGLEMALPAERLLRLLVLATDAPAKDYSQDIRDVGQSAAKPLTLTLERTKRGWRQRAA
jgi:putative zinc finger/helix-turn-helix YgiT family protein